MLLIKKASPHTLPALPPKNKNLRDPIACIPEVQALSAPGGLVLQGLAIKLVMNSREARNWTNIGQYVL